MVKKLMKHEMLYYVRLMIPMYVVLLGVALLGRVLQIFESDTTVYDILFGSSVVAFVGAIVVVCVLTTVFGIVRFYRHLFSGEGYLSFTLPVTPAQHIAVKVIGASLFTLATLLAALVSACVFAPWDVLVEVCKAAAYLLKMCSETVGAWHLPLYALEFTVLILVAMVAGYLLYASCIAIGQTFRKNRVLAAVGIYFVYYMITQFIGTIFSVVLSMMIYSETYMNLVTFMESHVVGVIHTVCLLSVVIYAILAVVFYAVTHYIMKNKLNLE